MQRVFYAQVWAAIADSNDANARAAAGTFIAAYYAIDPPRETTCRRMAFLKEALRSALEREGKQGRMDSPDPSGRRYSMGTHSGNDERDVSRRSPSIQRE